MKKNRLSKRHNWPISCALQPVFVIVECYSDGDGGVGCTRSLFDCIKKHTRHSCLHLEPFSLSLGATVMVMVELVVHVVCLIVNNH
jgi:hypothetical protein